MFVSQAIGQTLQRLGGDVVFGLMGSGNLEVTNAIVAAGGRFISARHETGAVCMADGYARVSGRLGVASVHQGPGLTNAITGLTEAAKSRTPLILLAADTPAVQLRSNFKIDQVALVESVGAVAERVYGPATVVADVTRAVRTAVVERRAVVLMFALDVQAAEVELTDPVPWPELPPVRPSSVQAVADLLTRADRPAIIGGRGAVLSGAGPALRRLGELSGAVLATSAVANGLFADDPFAVGISGGFATPVGQKLLGDADVIVAFGASLNHWTTRHGALVAGATLVQVDRDAEAIGAHRAVDFGLVGDARETAEALIAALTARRDDIDLGESRRSVALAAEIAGGAWRDVPYEPSRDWLDPRDLSIALDAMLPVERTVVVDSGAFMGYPSMYLRVPDAHGFVFPQAFQCVGLALGNALGAAAARPDRLTVCAVGDGGLLMALPDLETLGRVKPDMLVVVYDDAAYGAEVHHFRPMGIDVESAQFPPTDFAALAEAAGCRGVTARTVEDLEAVREWVASDRDRPLVLDAKVDPDICAEWLEEAFRGH
ncbi:thiamine pyrophosphate-binding protein [Solirubrobacter ginsenosidimutans]|uniref:Thiamine pyrophosphate-binding protein n=1 Tax=Solirubrobacter ginsenosidimutans TaxID=490573 RepID=A0A9X3S3D2_9ACTN|nr:thiamine pyrophosphate-binding protein [Solirubrobacter ginsenosidimutans]MDA0159373.1 thiamine pyrophosphate-binding protein [Solirubrobacter ginsenosidimutans]